MDQPHSNTYIFFFNSAYQIQMKVVCFKGKQLHKIHVQQLLIMHCPEACTRVTISPHIHKVAFAPVI